MVRAKAQPAADDKWTSRKEEKKEEYLLVDGYNIIFAWEELKRAGKVRFEKCPRQADGRAV